MKLKQLVLMLLLLAMFVNFGLSVYIQDQKSHNEASIDLTEPCFVGGGCYTVQTSYYAETFGISNPYYGIFFFSVLAMLIALIPCMEKRKHRFITIHYRIILGIMLAGSIFSLWLLYVQFLRLHATCIYCLWVDGIMIIGTILFASVFKKEIFKKNKKKK